MFWGLKKIIQLRSLGCLRYSKPTNVCDYPVPSTVSGHTRQVFLYWMNNVNIWKVQQRSPNRIAWMFRRSRNLWQDQGGFWEGISIWFGSYKANKLMRGRNKAEKYQELNREKKVGAKCYTSLMLKKTIFFAKKCTERDKYICESSYIFEVQTDYLLYGGTVTVIIYKL